MPLCVEEDVEMRVMLGLVLWEEDFERERRDLKNMLACGWVDVDVGVAEGENVELIITY